MTGAAGFIGSHLVERLAVEGLKVRAFVRYNSQANLGHLQKLPESILENVDVFFGDLRDRSAVAHALVDIDLVYHLGALISIPYSYLHPAEVVETNVNGTLNLLMEARAHEGLRIVHTSTSEVYGTAQYVPIDEEHPLQGQSPYAASKIGADKLVESFVRSYGLVAVTVRPFNAYGPRQSMRAVIPTIIAQALWADRIRLGNLSPVRDFTYVDDVVAGFIKAGTVNGIAGETINLGNAKATTIGDVVELILELVGRDLLVESDDTRWRPEDSEVYRLCAGNSRAAELLDWSPAVTFRDGLERTIHWIRDHPEEYSSRRQFV